MMGIGVLSQRKTKRYQMRKAANRKEVVITLPKGLEIGLAESKFSVYDDNGKVGELQVSKGSVVWFPFHSKLGYQMGWEKFNEMMMENGNKARRR